MLTLTFYSCQKDEFVDSTSNNNTLDRFEVETVSGKQIKNHQSLQKIFLGFGYYTKEKSTTHKGVYNNENNFSIDTTFGILIKDLEKNLYSYNFEITRDTIQNNVENLVIVFDATNQYQTFMVDYGFTKKDYQTYSENNMPISADATIRPIHFNIEELNIDLANKCTGTTYECYESYDWGIDDPGTHGQVVGHDEHEHWTSGWVLTGISCGYVSCSGGSEAGDGFYIPGSGGSGGGGGSSNGGDDNDFDPTDPNNHGNGGFVGAPVIVLNPEKDESFEDNCEELKKLIANSTNSNPYINGNDKKKPRLAIINIDSHLSSNFEHGYALDNIGDYPVYGSLATLQPPTADNHVYFPVRAYRYGTIHTHPDHKPWIPMFSADDMYSLVRFKENYNLGNPAGDALFVSILVVRQGYQTMTYAIKIEDPVKLLANLNKHKLTKKKWRNFEEDIQKYYMENANGINGSATQYQKAFLSLVEEFDLGISLYKMKPYDQRNNQMETWENLALSKDKSDVNKSPCNN